MLQLNLDQRICKALPTKVFDVVLQIDTFQHLRNAQTMLLETALPGMGIIAFPTLRTGATASPSWRGRMPVMPAYPTSGTTPPTSASAPCRLWRTAARNGLRVLD